MEMRLHPLRLSLTHPFTISRETIVEQASLVVELSGGGLSGWGEVTENSYYRHSIAELTESLQSARSLLPRYQYEPPESVWSVAMEALKGDTFAVSALDMAAHDWWARRQGIPTWQAWGLTWNKVPASSYTIAIDTIEQMQVKLAEQPNWPIYKIKLGTQNDLKIVRALRSRTRARFRVDANCAWNVEQTIEMSQALAELGVEFIEQPLPAEASPEQHQEVFSRSRLPIIADESCQLEADVQRCHGRFHGINIKICKCGGLTPALRMLKQARQLGMLTMVGCMIESSIGISGAAQLLPLLDFADLDGAALLARDPASGVTVCRGEVRLTGLAGTGAVLT